MKRCSWVDLSCPSYIRYHDEEWGVYTRDEHKLYEMLLKQLQIRTYALAEGVTVTSREKYLFVQNFNSCAVTAEIPGTYRNVETGEVYKNQVDLQALDVVVLCPET